MKRAIVAQVNTRSRRDAKTSQTPPPRRRRTLEYVGLAIASVLMIDALVGDKGVLAMMQAREQYRELEVSLSDARSENVRLREEARRLREDPTAVEEIARRELGLIKPGERLFIVKDLASPTRR